MEEDVRGLRVDWLAAAAGLVAGRCYDRPFPLYSTIRCEGAGKSTRYHLNCQGEADER